MASMYLVFGDSGISACLPSTSMHSRANLKHRGHSCLGQQVDNQPQPWCLLCTLELVRAMPAQLLTPLTGCSQRFQLRSSLLFNSSNKLNSLGFPLPLWASSLSSFLPSDSMGPSLASHFGGSTTVFGLQCQKAPNNLCYLAVRSPNTQLWAEQLLVFGSPTMHKPVKAGS